MEEHRRESGFLVGCFGRLSWCACVLCVKGGFKGKWVLTRGQLKLLSAETCDCAVAERPGDAEE